MKAIIQGVSFIAMVGAGIALPTMAVAQTTPAASEADSDAIIVTARKREENLQDVPLAITAVTAERIQAQGLTSIADVANVTPGLSFRTAFGRNGDRPVIRGQSNIQGNPNAAFFVDGIFVTGSISSYQLDNLERVEVIKGPQSALYGRNTFSGAINYITRKPGNEFEGRVAATYGQDGYFELTGHLTVPIIKDGISLELNGRLYKFDGQYANQIDSSEKLGREKTGSYGATLRLQPTETTDIIVRAGVSQDNDGAYPIVRLGRIIGQTLPVAGQVLFQGINCFQPQFTGTLTGGRPTSSTRSRGYFCGEVTTPGDNKFALNTAEFRAAGYPDALLRKTFRYSVQLNQELGDWNFVATGAANRRRQVVSTDQDQSDARVFAFETIDASGTSDESLELRLSSPQDSWIRGTGGVYHYGERDRYDNYSAALLFGSSRVFQIGDPESSIIRNAVSRNAVNSNAIFGHLEIDPAPGLTISVEGRYQEEKISLLGSSTSTVAGVVYTRNINATQTYRSFTPRITIDYKATPDVLLYAVAARGNKPGGFNSGTYGAVYDDTEIARFASLGLNRFKEESAWTYEIGAKTQWFDKRVTANISMYYIDWKNQQLTQTVAASRRDGVLANVSFTSNVGRSEVKGGELEISAKLGGGFDLRLGYALQDTKVRDFISDDQLDLYITAVDIAALNTAAPLPPVGTAGTDPRVLARIAAVNALLATKGNAKGNHLPRVPMHQLQAGLGYSGKVGNDLRLFARADLAYESKRFIQVDNLGWSGDSYNLGLRAGLEINNITITAFMTNALNDRTPIDVLRSIDPQQTFVRPVLRAAETTANAGLLASTTVRDFVVTAPRLRNFGVTVAYKW